jgi:hypothetical protein
MQIPFLREKQIRIATIGLAVVTVLFIGILGFRLMSGSFVRAEDIAPKNVTITDTSQNSAKVKWTTERETQSVVEYGTSPTSLTFFAPEAIKTKDHTVELNLLSGGTTYYFQIRTGDKKFDNGGVPWTFTTLTQELADADITPGEGEEIIEEETETTEEIIEEDVTLTPATSITPTTSVKDTKCSFQEYKNYFGTNTPKYDQDNNGVVNFRDWSLCQTTNGTLAPSSTPTPRLSATPTPNPS